MRIRSLGFQTDLALLRLGGSVLDDRGSHVVVRTPHNPAYWWGNFLLLPEVPADGDVWRWLAEFAETFPDATHLALGFDGVDGAVDDLAAFSAEGLSAEAQSVMTATSVHPPPRPNHDAEYRRLTSDDDWARHVELNVACEDSGHEPAAYREFATQKSATYRALAEAGHGAWFGAFVDGRLLSTMGMFRAGTGLGRFQSVETHPEARRQGLAGTLVHHVSQYAFGELGAETLVMVADPLYTAIRVYESVGFATTESQLQVERPLPTPA